MPLSAGTCLGPYEIVAPLAARGMGEVYRARDSRLGRDVAVKVLPAAFSADADRLHRFEQEARAAAAHAQWRRDGREIFYVASGNRLMSVGVAMYPDGSVDVGTPKEMF